MRGVPWQEAVIRLTAADPDEFWRDLQHHRRVLSFWSGALEPLQNVVRAFLYSPRENLLPTEQAVRDKLCDVLRRSALKGDVKLIEDPLGDRVHFANGMTMFIAGVIFQKPARQQKKQKSKSGRPATVTPGVEAWWDALPEEDRRKRSASDLAREYKRDPAAHTGDVHTVRRTIGQLRRQTRCLD